MFLSCRISPVATMPEVFDLPAELRLTVPLDTVRLERNFSADRLVVKPVILFEPILYLLLASVGISAGVGQA